MRKYAKLFAYFFLYVPLNSEQTSPLVVSTYDFGFPQAFCLGSVCPFCTIFSQPTGVIKCTDHNPHGRDKFTEPNLTKTGKVYITKNTHTFSCYRFWQYIPCLLFYCPILINILFLPRANRRFLSIRLHRQRCSYRGHYAQSQWICLRL